MGFLRGTFPLGPLWIQGHQGNTPSLTARPRHYSRRAWGNAPPLEAELCPSFAANAS